MKRQDLIKLIILGTITVIAYIPTFIWMYERWTAADTYYSHGFLVPAISGFIVWLKRKELSALKPVPSVWGWVLFGLGALIHSLSALWKVYFSSGFSIFLVLAGLALLWGGKDCLKVLAFPIL
ncbi:MAG: exosortase/archaeosortase family protein, partial [Candidatus Omnitrophica bacterium]|nr:exosortase/archaeosortase family protein [Candidatus Omnitrophota bacterium]